MAWWHYVPLLLAIIMFLLVGTVCENRLEGVVRRIICRQPPEVPAPAVPPPSQEPPCPCPIDCCKTGPPTPVHGLPTLPPQMQTAQPESHDYGIRNSVSPVPQTPPLDTR